MAKIKFSEILQSKVGVDLEFVDLVQDETADGSPIARLVLKEPLGTVYGRQISDPVTGDRVRIEANDVEMVSIGKEALEAIEALEEAGTEVFTWIEAGKSGHIKCNLFMDVSNAQEVWIVKTKFAAFAANQRRNRTTQQRSNLVERVRNEKTKKEFKGADMMINQNPKASLVENKPEVTAWPDNTSES